jgi:hypothetical protein
MEALAILGGITAIITLIQQTNEVAQLLMSHRSDSVELRNTLTNLSYYLPLLEKILVKLDEASNDEKQSHEPLIKDPIQDCYRCIQELKTILDKIKSRIRDGHLVFPKFQLDYKKNKIAQIVKLTNTIERKVQTLMMYRGMVYMSRTDLYTVRLLTPFPIYLYLKLTLSCLQITKTLWLKSIQVVSTSQSQLQMACTIVLKDPVLLLRMFLALLPTIILFLAFSIVCATFWLVAVLRNEGVLAGLLCAFLDKDDAWLISCLKSLLASWKVAHCVVEVASVEIVKTGSWLFW